MGEIIGVKLALNLEMDKNELYWGQRARANRMKNGDRNTTFFHSFSTIVKRRNWIDSLEKVSRDDGLGKLGDGYFKELFTSQWTGNMDRILSRVESSISGQVNENLLSPFQSKEII